MKLMRWPSLDARCAGECVEVRREELLADLSTPKPWAGEYNTPGWSPIRCNPPFRNSTNVVEIYCLLFDFDGTITLDELVDDWKDYAGLAHTTKKHSASSPRLRLLLFLDRPITVDEHALLWKALAPKGCDPATKDPARFWFGAIAPLDGSAFVSWELEGVPVDVDGVLLGVRREVTTPPPSRVAVNQNNGTHYGVAALSSACTVLQRTPKGERNVTLNKEAYAIGGLVGAGVLRRDEAESALRSAVAGWDKHDERRTERTLQAALKRGEKSPRAIPERRSHLSIVREPGDDSDETTTPDAAPGEDPADWTARLSRSKEGAVKNTYGNLCLILRHAYGSRLTYNAMKLEPMLDGSALKDSDVGRIREEVERDWGISPAKDNSVEAIRQISVERSFHPLQDYLTGLAWDGVSRIDRIAEEILFVEPTPLTCSMLRRWLVSAVARALEPGCKVDTSLVLVGEQKLFKSTFFSILGREWFSDTPMDISNKDALLQLADAWIYEWSELENVTSRKNTSEVKAFLTSRIDKFRPPFGRGVIDHPRGAVIVGSTNQPKFLNDPTGSRRFWAIQVDRRCDREKLRAWRDQIWAEAVQAYRGGLAWYLDDDEDTEREDQAEQFRIEDAWEKPIESWLEGPRNTLEPITTSLILKSALHLDYRDQTPNATHRLASVMRRLGYESSRRRAGGRQAMIWVRCGND